MLPGAQQSTESMHAKQTMPPPRQIEAWTRRRRSFDCQLHFVVRGMDFLAEDINQECHWKMHLLNERRGAVSDRYPGKSATATSPVITSTLHFACPMHPILIPQSHVRAAP